MSSSYDIRPTIPGRYITELLAHTGADPKPLLAAAGLSLEALTKTKFRASVEHFERLWHAASKAGDDELFGYLTRKVPRGAYAFLMRLASRSRDLSEFFDATSRFYALFDEGHRHLQLARNAEQVTLRVVARTDAQRRSSFFVHAMLLTVWRSASWLVGETIPLRSIRLDPRFRRLRSETAFLFGRDAELVRHAAELSFDAAWLKATPRASPDAVDAYARDSLRQMLSAPAADTLEIAVRGLLAADQPVGTSDLADVARRLHLSRATLARRLAARGLAFQSIKDDLRRDHAVALLTGQRLTIADVASRLGFSEPSAFARAFKSWTGTPPARYRTFGRVG